MEALDLKKIKMSELKTSELKRINGGNIVSSFGYAVGYAAGVIVDSIQGAYQRGYDAACGCS